jgi:putative transcriptional regulator
MRAMLKNSLKEFRARHNLTQEDLATQVGVTRQTIIAIEKGRFNPSVLLALKMARALDAGVEELFRLEAQA